MEPNEIIALLVLVFIIGGAAIYIVKAKKSGKKCIGCPDGCSCGKKDGGCSTCGSCSYCSAEQAIETAETEQADEQNQTPEGEIDV